MRIAVDIMSGDNTPDILIKGAIKAASNFDVDILLVGDESLKAHIPKNTVADRIRFVPSYSVIEMDDEPVSVIKEKADSSMAIAASLLKNGEADVLVSAGNTGALFTAASLLIRRVKGVRRAALGTVIKLENAFIMLDVGANTDATPDILSSFGKMGSLYAKGVLGIENPRVALLNNGTEQTKGTPLYSEAYSMLMADKSINFIGNCEGRDLPNNFCDVVVCDGFTGNIALKLMEGMGAFMSRKIKGVFYFNLFSKIAGLITKRSTDELKKQMDHKEYGGAPFLGISKPVIKAHGSSDDKGIYSAIRQAKLFYNSGIIEKMSSEISNTKSVKECVDER
ncbi:MAG: phosphate--acyl-ACP acyltransferase [Firmicutes bacterium HGW-Firmicutes-21]|nr:MAG: phosphate--acyl-ACP acyltransferase [Firmicutes bacterium HGW-Firmicutes-21]